MQAMRILRYVRNERSLWKGAAAGAVAGLAAAWAMNQFQSVWSKAAQELSKQSDGAADQEQKVRQGENEDATMKAAGAISMKVSGRELTKEEKKRAGPLVHYAFGTFVGALYGLLAERTPQVKIGGGVPFATALFLLADEVAVPAFGLSKAPTEYPLSTHASSLAAHMVYGVTTEAVRSGVRQALRFA